METQKENAMTQKNGAKIKVTKNGPYIISGKISLQTQIIVADSEGTATEWQPSTKYASQEKYSLCRCGHSRNKPFCDGTHIKVGFDGTETAGEETYLTHPKDIDGPLLKLEDIEELCASARFCHRASGIWNLVPKSDNPEKKQIAIEETCDCPSGRLVIMDKRTGKTIEPKFAKSIALIEDPAMGVSGPIWARGGIPVESNNGKTYQVRNRITLCRCGKSKNKPYCDSSHYPEAESAEKIHNE
ncbi:MAG: CDGSH iron-sulfur domain-containing protein [Candidatus Bathyarchaeota archaeon]|nr:CDGSH iron-sulfur domain-containing protein [Candidatus Bathyarchaeota archaeon]